MDGRVIRASKSACASKGVNQVGRQSVLKLCASISLAQPTGACELRGGRGDHLACIGVRAGRTSERAARQQASPKQAHASHVLVGALTLAAWRAAWETCWLGCKNTVGSWTALSRQSSTAATSGCWLNASSAVAASPASHQPSHHIMCSILYQHYWSSRQLSCARCVQNIANGCEKHASTSQQSCSIG